MSVATDITARPLDLSVLLDGIAEGHVVLPDFQREFVWSDGDVLALIATVMVGWPAGSLLLMRGKPTFFTTKEFQGAPPQKGALTYVVLDGQQRLTALFRAFRRSGAQVYAVDLAALGSGRPSAEQLEEALKVFPVNQWDAEHPIEAQARNRLVPLYALSSASDYFQWRDRVVESAAPAERPDLSDLLASAYKDFLGTVNHYQFPAVILDQHLPVEAVARIFERINRGGQELSTFDLLVARSYTRDWNLRDEWTRTRAENSQIDAYLGNEGLPIIQALALARGGVRDIRRPALLDLSPQLIQEHWSVSVDATERALNFISAAGMRHPAWMPYPTLVIPLAALAIDHPIEQLRDVLEAWLWGRSFGGDYDVASSTKIAADYALLDRAFIAGERPTFFVPIERLLGATRRQGGSLWRAFLSLMVRNGAVDPFTGEPLVPTPSLAGETVVVPMYPRASGRDEDAPHLRLLAQALVRRGHHRGTGKVGALPDILREGRATPDVDERLATQFIPALRVLETAAGAPEQLFTERYNLATEFLFGSFSLLRELVEATEEDD